jgi:hypothetical protein
MSHVFLISLDVLEADRGFGSYMVRDEVTNRAQADRMLKQWADILGDLLLHALSTKDSAP